MPRSADDGKIRGERGGAGSVAVYVERGSERTFACAVDWPGWARSGRDEPLALEALLAYAPRYARVMSRSRLEFRAPTGVSALHVVERLRGNATTDFGAPAAEPAADRGPIGEADLGRFRKLFEASWRAFDAAVDAARGKTLRKGPRGGGRELDAIVRHVVEADAGYLGALGWKYTRPGDAGRSVARRREGRSGALIELEAVRLAMLEGLAASARGEIPARGPRGGMRWKPRRIVRRSIWHVLDHAWEIEDRSST